MESESHVGCCRMGIFIFAAFAIVIGCGIFGKIKIHKFSLYYFFTLHHNNKKITIIHTYLYVQWTQKQPYTVLGIIDVNGIHYPTIVMGIYVIVTHVILFLGELNTHDLPFNYSVYLFFPSLIIITIHLSLTFSWIHWYNTREEGILINKEEKQSGKSH